MNIDPNSKIAGVPAWTYAALAMVVAITYTAWKRHGGGKPSAAIPASPAATDPPYLVVVATPQTVTPYDLPVSRVGGSRLVSTLGGSS